MAEIKIPGIMQSVEAIKHKFLTWNNNWILRKKEDNFSIRTLAAY